VALARDGRDKTVSDWRSDPHTGKLLFDVMTAGCHCRCQRALATANTNYHIMANHYFLEY
jgi:hypothetical protein